MGGKPRVNRATVLVLRTSNPGGKAYGGFQWPKSGPVEAPDWDPAGECGQGLHGALWGEGNGGLFSWEPDALWQVVEVLEQDVVDLRGKVKFPRGNVIYSGTREEATKLIQEARPQAAVIGSTATAGYKGTATAGHYGTATAGDYGTATAGYHGTAAAGYWGTAIAGDRGTATAGYHGTATAGYWGLIAIKWWNGVRCCLLAGNIGEDGLEADTPYKVLYGEFKEVV